MSNRTVPAAAEGLPKRRRNMTIASPDAPASIGYTADLLELARRISALAPDERQALKAAVTATKRGVDPTEEIVAAVGTERAGRFVSIWQVFVADAAEGGGRPMNRREALRTLAAGSAAGALAAGAVVAIPSAEAVSADPCLAFVTAWDAASDLVAATPDDAQEGVWKTRCEPFDRAAFQGEILAATTAAGAAAAIRKAINFGDMQEQDEALVRAALAYLDGAAS